MMTSKFRVKLAARISAREGGGGEGGGVSWDSREGSRVGLAGRECRGAVMCDGSRLQTGPAPRRRWVSAVGAGRGGRRDSTEEGTDPINEGAVEGLVEGASDGPGPLVRGMSSVSGVSVSSFSCFGFGRTAWSPRTT